MKVSLVVSPENTTPTKPNVVFEARVIDEASTNIVAIVNDLEEANQTWPNCIVQPSIVDAEATTLYDKANLIAVVIHEPNSPF